MPLHDGITNRMLERARNDLNILHLCTEGAVARSEDDELVSALLNQLHRVLEDMEPILNVVLDREPENTP